MATNLNSHQEPAKNAVSVCPKCGEVDESKAELLEALKLAGELVSVARQHFPKSMHNSDKFQLEGTCVAIGAAIAKATTGGDRQ